MAQCKKCGVASYEKDAQVIPFCIIGSVNVSACCDCVTSWEDFIRHNEFLQEYYNISVNLRILDGLLQSSSISEGVIEITERMFDLLTRRSYVEQKIGDLARGWFGIPKTNILEHKFSSLLPK